MTDDSSIEASGQNAAPTEPITPAEQVAPAEPLPTPEPAAASAVVPPAPPAQHPHMLAGFHHGMRMPFVAATLAALLFAGATFGAGVFVGRHGDRFDGGRGQVVSAGCGYANQRGDGWREQGMTQPGFGRGGGRPVAPDGNNDAPIRPR